MLTVFMTLLDNIFFLEGARLDICSRDPLQKFDVLSPGSDFFLEWDHLDSLGVARQGS